MEEARNSSLERKKRGTLGRWTELESALIFGPSGVVGR